MPMSSYPNGFADGLSVRGMPINIAYPGKVVFLNNSGVLPVNGIGASDLNPGTYHRPFSTLSAAVSACTANRGDMIMVMPGHAETISSSTALTLSTAGVLIVGMGQGTKRPTFTLDTANTSTINVTADNIGFINCRFIANFLAVAACFTLTTAKFFSLSQCTFDDTSAILNFAKIVNTGSTDNAADGLNIENCKILSAHATNAFSVFAAVGNMAKVTVKNNYIKSVTTNAAAAICPITAGKVLTNVEISGNSINTVGAAGTTTGLLITTNGSTNSGLISNNYIQNLDATSPILVTASSGFIFMENYYQSAADKSGALLPANA
jgi:hypothetical protein